MFLVHVSSEVPFSYVSMAIIIQEHQQRGATYNQIRTVRFKQNGDNKNKPLT